MTRSPLSSSTPLRKFLFDDPQPVEIEIPTFADLEPLDTHFPQTAWDGAQDTLDWERHQAFEQGRIQGRSDMEQYFYDQQHQTLEMIQKHLEVLVQHHQDFSQNLQTFLGRSILSLLHKVVPGLESFCRHENIQAQVQQVIESHSNEPLLKLYLNPKTLKELQPMLAPLHMSLDLHDDLTLTPSDCRITWADGGFEYRLTHIMNALSAILQPPSTPTPSFPMMEPHHD